MLFETAKQFEVGRPVHMFTEGFREQRGEARVGRKQPAARRDAVGFVLEFAWVKRVELREEVLFEQFGVERGHAVYGVTAGDGEVGHAYGFVAMFVDERAGAFFVVVARPLELDLLHQATIDVENDL